MEERRLTDILRQLGTSASQQGWDDFLQEFSPLIFQVVGLFEREPDASADCFLFVCGQLTRNRFRRLRSFRLDGRASFSTWLRMIVRNLCIDWHRKEFGRHRVFESVRRLGLLEQQVFAAVYERGLSEDETLATLRAHRSDISSSQFSDCLSRVRRALTARQQWLLLVRRPRVEAISGDSSKDDRGLDPEMPDPKLDPESVYVAEEQVKELERAVGRLSSSERLIIRLRFEQGLKLREVAELLGFKDALTADRRIREILAKLRRMLPPELEPKRKSDAMSV